MGCSGGVGVSLRTEPVKCDWLVTTRADIAHQEVSHGCTSIITSLTYFLHVLRSFDSVRRYVVVEMSSHRLLTLV